LTFTYFREVPIGQGFDKPWRKKVSLQDGRGRTKEGRGGKRQRRRKKNPISPMLGGGTGGGGGNVRPKSHLQGTLTSGEKESKVLG